MVLTPVQTLIMIAAVALGVIVSRFLPFVLFPEGRAIPPFVAYLGRMLPPAMMGLLVVYCMKGASVTRYPYGIPEFAAGAVVAGLQLWKGKPLLSIGLGTMVYMVLVQGVL